MAAAVTDMARRHMISQILLDLVKFAVGSAIDGTRKIIPGRKQVDKMVPEGLINIPFPTPVNAKKHAADLKVASDLHFERKMEEVKEDNMNNIKQQYKASNKRAEESQPPNKSDDGFKEINLVQGNGRRVFIRSRL